MTKQERREFFKKLEKLPKAVRNTLTAKHLARHIKVMRGVCHG